MQIDEPPLIPMEPDIEKAYVEFMEAKIEAMHANTARNKARGKEKELKNAEHAVKLKKYYAAQVKYDQLVNPKVEASKIRQDLTLSCYNVTIDIEALHLSNNQLPAHN
jgi:hypothetical protein